MKRFLIIAGVVVAFGALFAFNKLTSKKGEVNVLTEVKQGLFEITVTNSGELVAERSMDIYGPQIGQNNQNQGGQQQRGNQGGMQSR